MTKIYFFLSHAFVYNDKILPVILELARQGCKVRTIVFDNKSMEFISGNSAYSTWLNQLTSVQKVVVGTTHTPWNRMLSAFRLLWLYFCMACNKNYLAFFDTKRATWMSLIANRIARFRGKRIGHIGRYFDFYQGFDEEAAMEGNRGALQKKKKKDRTVGIPSFDKVLVYDESMVDAYPEVERKETLVLHHPKMQPWWRRFLDAYPPAYDNDVVEKADGFISLFLTHQGNYFFEDGKDLHDFIREIIHGIRAVYPDILIVIKPKVTVDRERLLAFLRELGESNITVSYMPVSLLAAKSICGISTCQSSAQFEFMCGGAPWIEYCRYSQFWKQYYPPETYSDTFGGQFVHYAEELSDALRELSGKSYDFGKLDGHLRLTPQDVDFDFFFGVGDSKA